MLTVCTGIGSRHCDGWSRRDFLRVGALSLGSLTLPQLLALRASGASRDLPYVRDKSVVMLYLSGGASHIETFDPKMTAPAGTRSVTGETSTTLPGVTYGGTFPGLAAQADRMAVVRSFAHRVGSHEQAHVHVLSGGTDPEGKQARGFSMGSCYTRLRGANHPDSGLPTYTLLTEEEIDGQYRSERNRIRNGSWPGTLGQSYAPFGHEVGWDEDRNARPQSNRKTGNGNNPLAANMKLNLPAEALGDRVQLLQAMDALRKNVDADASLTAVDKFRGQALDLLLGGAADAFDFRQEKPELIERYDTSHIRIGHKKFRPSTLGKQMLVARRLCEAGCGFVTVHSAGWDMHADGNNPGIQTGMEMLGRSLDQAVSAFLQDLADRHLSDDILLVITGDFGRTPRVNKNGGRDHWAKLGTLAFAGGGLPMGQVIGQSARGADVPSGDPLSTGDLMATIMHTLFDVGQLRLQTGLPGELVRLLENGRPIPQLV
ncbi:MAG TPA: DUF1501 domain-containing protein [Planctomycetaceae bacterium]|nr:hypothetical protein [Blastopirellula sp.]HAY80978.1 DUF1501 domain-containing protein [Planctomycetaceae bacterium]